MVGTFLHGPSGASCSTFGKTRLRSPALPKGAVRFLVPVRAQSDLQSRVGELLNIRGAEELVSKLQTDTALQQTAQPHFGTAAVSKLIEELRQRLDLLEIRLTGPTTPLPQWLRDAAAEAETMEHTVQDQLTTGFTAQGSSVARQGLDALWGYLSASRQSLAQQRQDRILSSLPGTAGTSGSSSAEPHFGSHTFQSLIDQVAHSSPLQAAELRSYVQAAQNAGVNLRLQVEGALKGFGTSDFESNILQQLSDSVNQIPNLLGRGPAEIPAALANLKTQIEGRGLDHQGYAGYSWATLCAVAAAVAVLVAVSTPPSAAAGAEADVLPPLVYDVDVLAEYWSQRPVAIARRFSKVLSEGIRWSIGLGLDVLRGRVRQNASMRAVQLRGVLERLGPAYVKVAQAVSTRVDLLEPEYLVEIERLQDRVPPFPTSVAKITMERAYGKPINQIFDRLSSKPLAAASLGQVFRGKLAPEYGGGEVAVKVQRPGVLLSVALDLFLMRWIAVVLDGLYDTSWTGIIDEWAGRFFHELDYAREAENAVIFKEQMAALDGITVPDVYRDLCSQEVLTTAWVEGEKLSESNAADVRELCNTLLNCYLIQLLETGFLHADPHPGNLLRTPDGKICILDYGLMTEITPDRSIALVEYIAHLITEDYSSIPNDLYKLGFIPPGAPDPMESGLVEPLGRILRQLSQGGGAKAINIDEVTLDMEELTKEYPFQIPSYFALILRAFSVIEGIALRADPQYAIVQECFPYLSRRLLTDNSPRMRAALQQMLYGKNRKRLDIGRLQRMASGFGNFTVGGLTASEPQTAQGQQQLLNPMTKEALRTLFRQEGSFIQEVFVEESVAAVDAVGRQLLSEVSRGVLGSVPAMATLSFVEALGPLRPFVLPVPIPLEVLSRFAPTIAPTEEDREALSTARTLLGLLQAQPSAGISAEPASLQRLLQLARELQPLLPEILPGVATTGELFARSLIRRIALRVAEEAAQRPRAQTTMNRPAQVSGQQQDASSSWLSDAVAASPLWLLLPPRLPGYPQGGIPRAFSPENRRS